MNFNEYQEKACGTIIYPKDDNIPIYYTTLGLVSESGEIAGKIKKVIRDNNGNFNTEIKKELSKEIGDVLWYCATLAYELGYNLDDIAIENNLKLQSRLERNTLQGSGDNR